MSLLTGAIKKQMNDFDIRKNPFVVFQGSQVDYYRMSQDSLDGSQDESILSRVFYHAKNVDLIQKQIIAEIFRQTNGKYLIEKQSDADLQIVMSSIFLQHAKHLPHNIRQQIRELNNLVVNEVLPGIISEIEGYFGYLERAFGPRQIMDLPENVSSTGCKALPDSLRSF